MPPSNYNTMAGDNGVHITSFSGAMQDNETATGAWILVKFGTISGTSPTCNVQLQWSYDGTNWLNIGPVSGNATATGHTIAIVVYPANISQSSGSTPTTLTSGATQTLAINAPLPYRWRLSYTIGGTNPSFTITGAYVTYCS